MRSKWTTMLRGYVKIEVHGQRIEELINSLTLDHFGIWQIRRIKSNTVELYVFIHDFFRLRPFLKRTGCRIHIIKRYGFPFLLERIEHRKLFVIGFIGFIIGIYLLSSLVWQVNIAGNETLTKQEILLAAKKHGIYPMQWKTKLDNPERISKELIKELDGVSWIGVEYRGTQIHIKVVESSQAEEKELLSPRHLISTSDAIITQMNVDKGRSLVKVNQRVKKGDILVSGILGDEESQKIVVASGVIKGLVWHEYEIEIPRAVEYNVYTGEQKKRNYLVIGNRALQITGYGKLEFKNYETLTKRSKLHWGKFSFPLGFMQETIMAAESIERMMDPNEAKNLGLQRARQDILLKYDSDAVIKEEKILHQKAESGKVYMKVLFEVEHEISIEQPIIQGE